MNYSDIVILGLTGPFGSGCTTFAKFFHNFEEEEKKLEETFIGNKKRKVTFLEYLESEGYFSKEKIKKIDKEIYGFYTLLKDIRKKLLPEKEIEINEEQLKIIKNRILQCFKGVKEIKEFVKKEFDKKAKYIRRESINIIKDKVFSELKVLLEEREALNAFGGESTLLNELISKDNIGEHHFRKISVSSIIVFKTILHANDKHTNINSDIKQYKKIAQKYRRKIEEIIKEKTIKKKNKAETKDFVREFYYNWFLKVDGCSDGELKTIKVVMKEVAKQVYKAKREFGKELGKSYRKLMQDFGDNIRKNGDPYNSELSYKESNLKNGSLVSEEEDTKYALIKDVRCLVKLLIKKGQHKVFIIDALRNPYEVLFLRKHFINFYLISIYADKEVRFERRGKEFVEEKGDFNKNDRRDKGEDSKGIKVFYGQNVTACSRLADISINNYVEEERIAKDKKTLLDDPKSYSLRDFQRKIVRVLALIIDKGCTKPNVDESLMNQAYAMSMRSNCISRQVGAVVADKDNYIIGAGWNDVGDGHISCGLIEMKDLKDGKRFSEYLNYLEIKQDIAEEINKIIKQELREDHCVCFKELISFGLLERNLKKNGNLEKINRAELNIKDISVKQHENCRALHAEENAILQSARRGGMGLDDGKIYTTTFPCPLCAKKIMQVGIKEVIFDDPYPAELSEIFFEDGNRKVIWRHFEGIKPLGYFRLFKPDHDQKEWQELEIDNLVEKPRFLSSQK